MEPALHLAPPLPRRAPATARDTRDLAPDATLRLRLPRGARVVVSAGRLWLTEPGDLADHFVEAGGQHVIGHGGRIVLQGDSPQPTLFSVSRRP